MNSKYYTPTIEEFHVGFEYYFSSAYSELDVDEIIIDGKDGYLLTSFDFNRGDVPYKTMIESWLKHDQVKVKYLDREDVESLGWVFDHENKFFVFFTKPGFRLALPTKTDVFEPYLYIEMYNKEVGESEFNHRMGMNFVGEIKNKSELKTILKQIGCTEM